MFRWATAWWRMPRSHRQAVLVPDVSKDPRYILLNPETRSELAVPLIYKDNVIGVLDLEHTRARIFYRRPQTHGHHAGRAGRDRA